MSLPACPYICHSPARNGCGALDRAAADGNARMVGCVLGPEAAAGFMTGNTCCLSLLDSELCPEGWR